MIELPLWSNPQDNLLREIEELRRTNEALRAGFRAQHQKIQQLESDLARYQSSPKADGTKSTSDEVGLTDSAASVWSAEFTLGANLSRGNNDSHRVKAGITATRKTEIDRLSFGVDAELGENEGDTSSEYIEGMADYRRDIHDRLFWSTLARARRDAVADLDYRLTLSPGLGYRLWDTDTSLFSVEAGPAYVVEQLKDQDPEHSLRARMATEFEWQITSYARLFQSLEFLANLQDTNDWIAEAELGVETSITRALSLRVSVKDTYDNQPASGREKNDISLNSAVVYKFK